MADKKIKKSGKGIKKYYFIDYENVHKTGISGLPELNKNDNVIIFYSGNANKLTFNLHQQIIDSKAEVTYFEVSSGGKNALDFQLSSYLGYILGKEKKCKCYIVSNDKGFEYVCSFWEKQRIKVKIIPVIATENIETISTVDNVKTPDVNLSKKDFENTISNLKLKKETLDVVWNILEKNINNKTMTLPLKKQLINTELCKKFGNDETKKIYTKIKPLIK